MCIEQKMCIFDDNKICDNCRDCEMCDVFPDKVCDNCGKCLEGFEDEATINIDKIIMNENEENEEKEE